MKVAGERWGTIHRRSESFRYRATGVDCYWTILWRDPLDRAPKEQGTMTTRKGRLAPETLRQKDRGDGMVVPGLRTVHDLSREVVSKVKSSAGTGVYVNT